MAKRQGGLRAKGQEGNKERRKGKGQKVLLPTSLVIGAIPRLKPGVSEESPVEAIVSGPSSG